MSGVMNAPEILAKLVSIGQGLGVFQNVLGHEPLAQPGMGDQITLAVFSGPVTAVGTQSGLNSATLRWQINGRVYVNAMSKPEDAVDPRVVECAAAYLQALCGAFTLGGLVRCVDVFGMGGEPLQAEAGYISQDRAVFRTMELQIPVLINDVFTLAP